MVELAKACRTLALAAGVIVARHIADESVPPIRVGVTSVSYPPRGTLWSFTAPSVAGTLVVAMTTSTPPTLGR